MRSYATQKAALLAAVILAVALVCLLSCSRGERPTTVIRTVPNGTTIIVEENRGIEVVSVQVWVRDGALYEPTDQVGAAMLLHSTIIDGRRDDELLRMAEEFSALGGKVTGYPSYDFVSFMATAPSRHFDRTARLMQKGLVGVRIDEGDIEIARDAVSKHIASYEKSEREGVYMAGLAALIPDHPYSVSSYGTMQYINSLTAEDLQERYDRMYVGANLVISVAGDVDAVEAANLMESLFSGIAAGERAEPASAQLPWPTNQPRIVQHGASESAYMIINYPGPAGSAEDVAYMDLLLMALARSRVSLLNVALTRDHDLVSDVGGGWGTHIQPYPFQAWMHLPAGNVSMAEQVTTETFSSLAEEEVSEVELERLKNLLQTEIAMSQELAVEQASYRGYWTIVGGDDFIDDYFARIESATPADLRRTAEKYFAAEGHLTTALLPQ